VINNSAATSNGVLFNQNSVYGGFEVEGISGTGAQILNLGVNMNRSKAWSSAYDGLWFRVDTRTSVAGYEGFHFFKKAATSGTETELMTILANGNVGIGTSSPGYALDCSTGTIQANQLRALTGNYLTLINGAGGSQIVLQGTTTAITGGAVYMTGGNVGIGTTSPGAALDVSGGTVLGSAGNTSWRIQPQYVNSSPFPSQVRLTNAWDAVAGTGQANYAGVGINLNSSQSGSAVEFYTSTTNNAAPTLRWTIDSSGNLNRNGSSATNSGINLPTGGAGITWGASYSRIYDDGDLRVTTDDNMHFSTSAGEKITIYSGNVGINNTAPSSQLQVTGQFYQSNGNMYLAYDTTYQTFIGSNRNGTMCKLNDDLWFSDPQNGNINIRNYNDTNWGTLVGIFSNQSTRDSKKDVTVFDQAKLESLYQDTIKTKVCSWHYKGDADYTPLKYGPILEDSPPYFTVTPDGESLYINQYVAMLHGALQVAIQKIESLETRLSTLENNTTQ
jgi:hypothetical protein